MHKSNRVIRLLSAAALLGAVIVAPAAAGAEGANATWRVSVDTTGVERTSLSDYPSVSEDGRYVAFESEAALVPEDTNGTLDIYRKDLMTGNVVRVSVSDAEAQSTGNHYAPSINADGRFVAWASPANDLAGDMGGFWDVFVRDVQAGTTRAVTHDTANSYSPSISGDGCVVVFHTDADLLGGQDSNGLADIYRDEYRILPGGGTWWSQALITRADTWSTFGLTDDGSYDAAVSHDGSKIAFHSDATNLVSGDTNGMTDVFLMDFDAWLFDNADHPITLISSDVGGGPSDGNSRYADLSADGEFVVFESDATDLVNGDTNGQKDAFRRWMGPGGAIAMVSSTMSSGPGNGMSLSPVIASDGRMIAFRSLTTNLIAGGDANSAWDVFVYDSQWDTHQHASLSDGGTLGNADSPANIADQPRLDIGGGGKIVAFQSAASNLVADDTNAVRDVFVHQLPTDRADIAGVDRFETAVQISQAAYPDGLDPSGERMVIIATGRNWPDALGGTALAGAYDAPILLCDTHTLPMDVLAELLRLGATKAIILGGQGAVGPEVETGLENLYGDAQVNRIGGLTRYETARNIASAVTARLGTDYDGTALVATGENYPDALAAAPLAAKFGWPIFLAHPASGLTGSASALGPVTDAVVLGGEGAVSPAVYAYLVSDLTAPHVSRIGGATRYQTAGLIAQHGIDNGLMWNHVALATGESFPDALAGGVLAAQNSSVMLLTTPASLHDATRATLTGARLGIANISFLGGTGAISDPVRADVMSILD